MNDNLFRPHGLFALIMTYKPEQKTDHEEVNISQTIAKSITPADSMIREQLQGLKLSSGKTYGELEMPESAPLVFPALDAAAASEGQEGKKRSALNKSSKFVASYLDRRAQAKYVRPPSLFYIRKGGKHAYKVQADENPNSSLIADQGENQFASRYSDPNHPASSGSLVALATGGALKGGRARRTERAEHRTGRKIGGKRQRGLKRLLQQVSGICSQALCLVGM